MEQLCKRSFADLPHIVASNLGISQLTPDNYNIDSYIKLTLHAYVCVHCIANFLNCIATCIAYIAIDIKLHIMQLPM